MYLVEQGFGVADLTATMLVPPDSWDPPEMSGKCPGPIPRRHCIVPDLGLLIGPGYSQNELFSFALETTKSKVAPAFLEIPWLLVVASPIINYQPFLNHQPSSPIH